MFAAVKPARAQTKLELIDFNYQHKNPFFSGFFRELSRAFSNEVYLWQNYWRVAEKKVNVGSRNKNYVAGGIYFVECSYFRGEVKYQKSSH